MPLGTVGASGGVGAVLRKIDDRLVRLRPTLFGYQNVLRLTPHAENVLIAAVEAHEADELTRAIGG